MASSSAGFFGWLRRNSEHHLLIAAHENAFLALGGTPREVLYDNMRTVVLERHGYGRCRHRFHPGFLDLARHCGFNPRLCAPYRAQTKGKVERFIRYLRHSFYVPLASRLASPRTGITWRGTLWSSLTPRSVNSGLVDSIAASAPSLT